MCLVSAAWAQDCSKDTITVIGIGKVTAKPDVAYVTLSVKADGILMADTAQKVKQKLDEIEKAIKAKKDGIKEIVTSDVAIGQKDSAWSSDEKDVARPQIVKQMRVTIAPDPQIAHDIVDAAIRAGASMDVSDSYSYSRYLDNVIVYGLIKSEEAEAQAQAKALEDARAKAAKLAALAGKTLGGVTSIGCDSSSSWSYQLSNMMRGGMEFPTTNLGLDPSKIDITHTMSVSFELLK